MESLLQAIKNGSIKMGQLDSALAEQPCACSVQPDIKLVDDGLWREFHHHTNEMIITKAGRRMFPLIQLILEGLDPKATYTLLLALRVKDPSRWRFLNGEWVGSEPGVRGVMSEPGPGEGYVYVHPLSPLTGKEWMNESPVSFAKLKLSNKDSQGEKAKLSSLHRYQPVAYLVKLPSLEKESRADQQKSLESDEEQYPSLEEEVAEPPLLEISEREFPETQFIAVTAYQNDQITQMKIKYNPFAKAFLPNQDKTTAASEQAEGPPTKQEFPVRYLPPPHMMTEQEALHWQGFMQPATYHPPFHPYYGDARYAPHQSYMESYEHEPFPPSMSYHSS